ncbi:MAG: selenocysteine-specific translation elongation factor [Deltaproteobacteria bacterium]|nr:selenocysteine-specific translation elongation factor [Deltaproteobacteria bacterium]
MEGSAERLKHDHYSFQQIFSGSFSRPGRFMTKSRHVVIGTAGHVDHGKTSLVLALTGIDADRLAEEKRRGITIVNGYAHFDLGGGERASVIDVPGHERFIRHMLAGSGAVDLALLVVAADDGVMPQTIEHLHILRLLGVRRAVVALTKCDLAPDEEWLALVEEDLRVLTDGVFDSPPPVVRVSSLTGQGVEELSATLREAALAVPPKRLQGRFRLPADRVFSMTGFGTVVTGSLLEGSVSAGTPAVLYPSEVEAKIRQVQVHSQTVAEARPGQRTALNLANLAPEDVRRGDVLATPGSLSLTMMLDADFRMLAETFFRKPVEIKNGRLVKLHLAAREITAKMVLINRDSLRPGEEAFVQFRLTETFVARKGDRFVVRIPSPALTVGGGEILDAAPLKRRRKPETAAIFETKRKGEHMARVELAVQERPGRFETFADVVKRSDLDKAKARLEANVLVDKGRLVFLAADIYVHQNEMSHLTEKITALLAERHRQNPFKAGVSSEEIRTKLMPAAPMAAATALFNLLVDKKKIVREGGLVRLSTFEPKVDERDNQYLSLLESAYLSYGFAPLASSAVCPESEPDPARRRKAAFATLVRQGQLVYLDDLYHMHKDSFEKAFALFSDLSAHGPVELGPFRDALNTSRKVALALLETFERQGLALKSGPGRLPRKS